MRIDHKRLVLGVALAGAMSMLIAGCGKNPEEQAAQPATSSQAATTPEPATTPQAATTPEPATTPQAATTTVGTEIDDSVITTKVKAALLADPDIKSFDIAVETHKGEVQLSGFVNSQEQIDQAIEIAKKVEGVTNVGNGMSIKK
ncbi:MAG: BON domain-containing protein [Burkholderiales bacterium]